VKTLPDLAAIGVESIRTVGPRHAEALAEMGIRTVLDLVTFYPRRWIDRTNQMAIADLVDGEEAVVLATVRKVSSRRTRAGRPLVEVDLFDGTSYLRATFFNQAWRARQLPEGTQVALFGKVERFRGRRQMNNPVVDLVGDRTGRIVPIYPQSEKAGLMTGQIADWVGRALYKIDCFCDPLPEEHRAGRLERDRAFRQIHNPETLGAKEAARRRLAFDELLRLQVALVLKKRAVERDSIGIRHRVGGELTARFRQSLPFSLTKAQERAMAEIAADLAGPHPMHRLLQGDVGAGKTLVAIDALLTAVDGGFQGVLMAPTEVLAEQHHASISRLLSPLRVQSDDTLFAERPLEVVLLTGRTSAAERARTARADILVGTHALLTETVELPRLGCVVIDEQHRFGVEQRAVLRERGPGATVPDVLVMTATPIPRTAAMTVYGDLDTTVLDELPPGRTPVETRWARGGLEVAAAWATLRQEVAGGHQAYVVCPLVEDSEKVAARSATEEFARLTSPGGECEGLALGLIHGQMPAAEKESVMDAFRAGRIEVLVATTVIEVGVDVPNATVMVIEDADRFGIAQLHQLRGRVGRGGAQSYCFLLAEAPGPESQARLAALERSTDGFELAEVDLELRGEGTILGTRQKGATDLKLASLRRDKELVAEARAVAFALVDAHPGLAGLPELAAEISLLLGEEEAGYLFKN
jgi:ATP-dependent DNA helicase RecG